MSRYKTRSGIVLRRHVSREGDVVLMLLTPEGKLRAVARSGVHGRRSSRLNLFQHLNVQLYEKPGNEFATLTEVTLEGALPRLAEPGRYPYAHLLAECADRLWQEGDNVGQSGFSLFAGGLRGVAHHGDPDRVALVIVWKLLHIAGLFPRLQLSGSFQDADSARFDPYSGEISREIEAKHELSIGLNVQEAVLEELALIPQLTVREQLEEPLEGNVREGLWRILEAYTKAHIGELHAFRALRAFQNAPSKV